MRKDITIAAEPRASRGKNEARRLRAKGQTPAVLYGVNLDPVAVAVNPKEISKILRSEHRPQHHLQRLRSKAAKPRPS